MSVDNSAVAIVADDQIQDDPGEPVWIAPVSVVPYERAVR
jgi:hypothetical protein